MDELWQIYITVKQETSPYIFTSLISSTSLWLSLFSFWTQGNSGKMQSSLCLVVTVRFRGKSKPLAVQLHTGVPILLCAFWSCNYDCIFNSSACLQRRATTGNFTDSWFALLKCKVTYVKLSVQLHTFCKPVTTEWQRNRSEFVEMTDTKKDKKNIYYCMAIIQKKCNSKNHGTKEM